MGKRVLDYVIRAVDQTKGGVKSAVDRIKSMASDVGKNLMNIKAGFDMLASGLRTAGKLIAGTMAASFNFEKISNQFQTLIQDVDVTKAHMADLREMAKTPPFGLEEAAAASRAMMVMSEGAIGYKESLTLVGDAAAATGKPIEQVGEAVGRAYAIIKDGQPITRATMQLRNMGVITPQVAAEMEAMQKAGVGNIEIWQKLEAEIGKYKGAMEATEQTGQGMIDAIKGEWDDAVLTFSEALSDTAKDSMAALLNKMREISSDGTLEVWAERVAKAVRTIAASAQEVGKALSAIYKYSGLSDTVAAVAAVSSAAGTLAGGGSWSDMAREAEKEWSKGFYGGKVRRVLGDPFGGLADVEAERARIAKRDMEIREQFKSRKAKERIEQEKQATNEREKIVESMRKAQEKQDADAAVKREQEAAKVRLEAAAKASEMEYKAAQEKLKAATEASRIEQDAARDRVQRAQDATRQLVEWYRDPEAYEGYKVERARIDALDRQMETDIADYHERMRGWFPEHKEGDDLLKQIIEARKEEADAQKHLQDIEKNTADLAKKLEDLLALKE